LGRKVRIRCPICGMLVWQDRLDEEFDFEVVIQDSRGAGRGKGFTHRYFSPESEEGVWLLKLALIQKLRSVADDLEREARREKDEEHWETIRLGEKWEYTFISGSRLVESDIEVLQTPSGVLAHILTDSREAHSVFSRSDIHQTRGRSDQVEEAESHVEQGRAELVEKEIESGLSHSLSTGAKRSNLRVSYSRTDGSLVRAFESASLKGGVRDEDVWSTESENG